MNNRMQQNCQAYDVMPSADSKRFWKILKDNSKDATLEPAEKDGKL